MIPLFLFINFDINKYKVLSYNFINVTFLFKIVLADNGFVFSNLIDLSFILSVFFFSNSGLFLSISFFKEITFSNIGAKYFFLCYNIHFFNKFKFYKLTETK